MNIAQIVTPYFRNFISFAVCVIVALGAVSAQTDAMLQVSGTIKDEDSGRKLPGCVVVVFQDGTEFDRLEGDNNAGYSFELPLRHLYTFQFNREGFVSKKVSLDVSDVPNTDAVDGFGFDLDMTLFKTIDGFDESILDTPIGKGTFDVESGKFNFDMEHTARVKQRIDNEKNRILSIEENRSKNKRAYDVAMKQGENAMKKKNWQEALGFFNEALVLIPDEEEAIEERDKARRELDAIAADLSEQQAEEDAANAAKAAEDAAADAERQAQEAAALQRKADAEARNAQSNDAAAADAAAADAAAVAAAAADAAAATAADAATADAATAAADADAAAADAAAAAADAATAAADAAAAAAAAAAADAADAADDEARQQERDRLNSEAASGEASASARKEAEEAERQTRLDYAAAQAEIEAANRKDAEEAERKRATLLANNANKETDEAEKYYRDALKSENRARADDVAARVNAERDMLNRREDESFQRKQQELEDVHSVYRSYDNSVDKVVDDMYKGPTDKHTLDIQDAQSLLDMQKVNQAGEMEQRRIDSESNSYDSRLELYTRKSGDAQTTEGSPTIATADIELPQGFYESSYKIQNGIVIERTIRNGDHVIHYRKVVMKTGTYYFRDGQSITSTVWHRETTVVHD